jgi:hypothetical protein
MESTPATEIPSTTRLMAAQLDWIWQNFTRPRYDGLTDEEYLWEPVEGCWSVREVDGRWQADHAEPEPDPAPVTTIAWRLGHLITGVFGERAHSHFDGPPCREHAWDYAGTADEALAQLDAAYDAWMGGVRALTDEQLDLAVGMAEGPFFASHPMSELVLHINREAIHHGAEVALLRDLYRAR